MGPEVHGRVPHLNHVRVLKFFDRVLDPVTIKELQVCIYPRDILPIVRKGLNTRVDEILLEPNPTIARESDVFVYGQTSKRCGSHSLNDHESQSWCFGVPLDELDKEFASALEPAKVKVRKDHIQSIRSLSYQTVHITL